MKIEKDKIAHFVVSLLLTAFFAFLIKSTESGIASVICGIYASIVTMCVGIGKEIWDKFRGTGFDLYDLAADAFGCLIAIYIISVIFLTP